MRYKHHPRGAWLALFLFIVLLLLFTSLAGGQEPALARDAGADRSAPDRSAVDPRQEAPDAAIERLQRDAGPDAEISINSTTGVASFVRLPAAEGPGIRARTAPAAVSDAFLAEYGSAFGVTDAAGELVLVETTTDTYGRQHLTYQQTYQGVDVFAGVLRVHLDAGNAVRTVNGTVVPDIKVDTAPRLSEDRAVTVAVDTVSGQQGLRNVASDFEAAGAHLYVFRSGLLQGVAGTDHLVYEVEVVNSDLTAREFLYVDAHNGDIVDQISGIHHALGDLDRTVSEVSLGNVVWQEGDPDPIPGGWAGGDAQQVTDWQNEIDGARETYNLFASMGGRDSYDGVGATMRTVNNDPGIFCPNANWNGTSTNYCSDVTGDDTVAHEWGHAYTEYTNGLIYQWQSGALNESYSDIWGEVVDMLNGRGTDSPLDLRSAGGCSIYGVGSPSVDDSYRWLSGEDDPAFGGAIRDMWNPTCYGDPGKVTDTAQYVCTTFDNGGVHINSGIPNHGFALMVDGGDYNGQSITGIGLTKAAHIHWAAQNMLTPASNFVDHANALEAACSDLTGIDLPALSTSEHDPGLSGEVISAADCAEVSKVIDAVEFRTEPDFCGFEPLLDADAPALCQDLGSVETIDLQDWEGGLGDWTVGSHSVANPATFDTPDWSVVSDLPDGRGGQAAFVPDLVIGNCSDDDETGVVYLESPVISLPTDIEVPRMAFDHWVATELGWDGGNLKISVNGGPWTLVPESAFEFNAYNQSLNSAGAGNTNPLAGEDAFTGTDAGSNDGTWGQSQVNLLGLAFPGDDIRLRYEFGVDGCNGVLGWYVDDVQTYSCTEDQGPVCGNSILEAGEACDDGNGLGGDGCSATCQIEDGWTCTAPIPPTSGTNVIDDGSFEAGTPNPSWDESSSNFGTPLCTTGTCGGPGASDGDWFTWFGGISTYEAGSVQQSVDIPSTATDLEFDLLVGVCDSSADYMNVLVDGNQVFTTDPCTPGSIYATQSVDVSAYADDATHTLRFESEIFANNGGNSNFFLDNVVLSDNVQGEGTPSQCTMITDELACNVAVGFDGGIPSGWTVTDNYGSGLVWSNIAGSGESSNYTGGSGDAASVSSDIFGTAGFDTELRSNPFDLSAATSASLSYVANYQNFLNFDFLDVDISTDGGATWDNLLSWNEDHGAHRSTPGEAVNIDLTPYVGMSDLILRWRYYDPDDFAWDWYAQVDNVGLSCEIPNEAPDCSAATPSEDILWPANHKFNAIDILGVTDPDGDDFTIVVDSIFQDEAVDAPGSGNTAPDGQGVGSATPEVRAERAGSGNGRVYYIDFTATDTMGASCSGTVEVGVPKSPNRTPVGEGPLFDSTAIP